MSESKTGVAVAQGLVLTFQEYVNKMLNVTHMKALVLDDETTRMVGMVYSLSEVIKHQVFLVENLEQSAKKASRSDRKIDDEFDTDAGISHLKCVAFVRPSEATFKLLERMLRTPKYKEYHIFFTNIVGETRLKQLAQADEHSLVRQVQEYYADFYAYDHYLWSLNLFNTRRLHATPTYWSSEDEQVFSRMTEGLLSVFLATKRRPTIRYGVYSELSKHLAQTLSKKIREEKSLFYFNQQEEPLLLIFDRREDPVTPLLTQWHYRAMAHELLTLVDNRIDMSDRVGVKEDMQQLVLSPHTDSFYAKSLNLNYGDLGVSVSQLVKQFQETTHSSKNMASIEQLQSFVDQFPEYKQESNNVQRHVAVMSELSKLVEGRYLLKVSELEQDLACMDEHSAHVTRLFELLEHPHIRFWEKLKLVMLYALRYETQANEVSACMRILRTRAETDEETNALALVRELTRYAGSQVRGLDVFKNKSFMAKVTTTLSNATTGVDNIYTQHKPLLASVLADVLNNKLKSSDFAWVEQPTSKPKHDVIYVFVVGGFTYEEAQVVNELNAKHTGVNIILGGSSVHNSQSFIKDIASGSEDKN